MGLSRHAVVDWESNPAPEAPLSPDSLKESGLTNGFICDMLLRTIYARGVMIGRDIGSTMRAYICSQPAPSMVAASMTSSEIERT